MPTIPLIIFDRLKKKSSSFLGIRAFNAPYFKRLFKSVIITTLGNLNTRVLRVGDLICLVGSLHVR